MTMPKDIWITNISRKAIHIVDIGVYIYPGKTINVMDKKHYKNVSEDMIERSYNSGSIKEKMERRAISVRFTNPSTNYFVRLENFNSNVVEGFPSKKRSVINIEKPNYEELDVLDSTSTDEAVEIAEADDTGNR